MLAVHPVAGLPQRHGRWLLFSWGAEKAGNSCDGEAGGRGKKKTAPANDAKGLTDCHDRETTGDVYIPRVPRAFGAKEA